jgi:hypothetical protein
VGLGNVAHLKNFRPAQPLLNHRSAHAHPNTAGGPPYSRNRNSEVMDVVLARPAGIFPFALRCFRGACGINAELPVYRKIVYITPAIIMSRVNAFYGSAAGEVR